MCLSRCLRAVCSELDSEPMPPEKPISSETLPQDLLPCSIQDWSATVRIRRNLTRNFSCRSEKTHFSAFSPSIAFNRALF